MQRVLNLDTLPLVDTVVFGPHGILKQCVDVRRYGGALGKNHKRTKT
jgi:hypothetical protein